MRMEFHLGHEKLNAFVSNHSYAHHMKTSYWGELNKSKKVVVHYGGFYQNQTLVATALILERRFLGSAYWYLPFGPCVEYQNKELLEMVLATLRQESLKRKVFFVRIDPNQERLQHEKNGEVVEHGYSYECIKDCIETQGFTHLGYGYGYSGNWQPRFTYLLEIVKPIEELIGASDKENQTYTRKNIRRCLSVRTGTREELSHLALFGEELAAKLKFEAKDVEYYQQIMDQYPSNHLYLIAEANLPQAIANIGDDVAVLSLQVEALAGKVRNQGRIKEITREIHSLQSEQNDIRALMEKDGDITILGAGLFVFVGEKSYDLYMYSQQKLTNFRSPIAIHYKAMELLKEQGVRWYDFVGISGSTKRSDPHFGLHDFKRRFGGDFIEYLGEFDCVNQPLRYRWFLSCHKNIRRIQRKLSRMRNRNNG